MNMVQEAPATEVVTVSSPEGSVEARLELVRNFLQYIISRMDPTEPLAPYPKQIADFGRPDDWLSFEHNAYDFDQTLRDLRFFTGVFETANERLGVVDEEVAKAFTSKIHECINDLVSGNCAAQEGVGRFKRALRLVDREFKRLTSGWSYAPAGTG